MAKKKQKPFRTLEEVYKFLDIPDLSKIKNPMLTQILQYCEFSKEDLITISKAKIFTGYPAKYFAVQKSLDKELIEHLLESKNKQLLDILYHLKDFSLIFDIDLFTKLLDYFHSGENFHFLHQVNFVSSKIPEDIQELIFDNFPKTRYWSAVSWARMLKYPCESIKSYLNLMDL